MDTVSIAIHLTTEERDKILSTLNKDQREFLTTFLKRGKRTAFANVLAKEKASGFANVEEVANSWELIDYKDAGPNWQSESNLFCECNRKLRYQYIVRNIKTNEIKKFGVDHFEDHTGIPANLAMKVKRGLEKIDYELDEILNKIVKGWSLTDEGIDHIPEDIEIPKDIQEHFDNKLPLLNRQVVRLRELIMNKKLNFEMKNIFQQNNRTSNNRNNVSNQKVIRYKNELELNEMKDELMSSQYWHEVKGYYDLEEDLQLGIVLQIKNSDTKTIYASDICEELVRNHGANGSKFSSGRYKITPDICLYLEYLVEKDKLKFVDKVNGVDRSYEILEWKDG